MYFLVNLKCGDPVKIGEAYWKVVNEHCEILKTKKMKNDEPVNAATDECYDYLITFLFIYINNTTY